MNRLLFSVLILLASSASAQQDAWNQLQAMAGGARKPAVKAAQGRAPKPGPAASATEGAAGVEKEKNPLDALKERIARQNEERKLFLVTESDHEGKPQRYLVIRFDQLDKPFLFNSTIERGPGKGFVMSTVLDDAFLVSILKAGDDKLRLVRRQLEHRADGGTPELRAIERTASEDFLHLVPIKASDTTAGYYVVSAEELFVKDLTQVGLRLQDASKGKTVRPSPETSFLSWVKAFPKNLEVQVQLGYEVYDQARAQNIPEGSDTVLIRYSISALPEDPGYQPRTADPRVGYFTTNFRDLSRADLKDMPDPRVYYIQRWKLEKKEPEAPVSEVREPIVFWLEDTIPERYRGSVRAGILSWNAAFEAVGLKNALVVTQVPAPGEGNADMTAEERASFDPADISYNLVRWYVEGFSGAVGPSRGNPLTGQIYRAVISVNDSMTRVFQGLDLKAAAGGAAGAHRQGHEAALRERARREAALALALRETEGPLEPAERERFLQEYITETLAHETGHTLGLEHNFKGSQWLRQEELGKDGFLTASVMDYNATHIAPPGKPQGPYAQTKVGPYDMWAVEYGYKPIPGDAKAQAAELKGIASRADSDRRLAHGNDADVPTDVDAQQFDLGQGALPFARSRVELAQRLWRRMAAAPPEPGEDNKRLAERFAAGFGAYFNAAESVLPLIGGQRTRRGSGRQFEPVPASEQRDVLKFVEENLFAAEPFKVSPQLLQRLGNDRLAQEKNGPFAIERYVGALQAKALEHVYSPETLQSLSGREVGADPGGRLSASELFDRVRRSIWSELSEKKPQPIHLYRRNLQEQHLARLIQAMGGASGAPADARGAARRDIERIARDAKKALDRQKDETSRLHLSEMLRRAQDALRPPR